MTDRHRGYIVALEQDLREDDSRAIIDAIKMIKGVLSVEPVITGAQDHIAEQRSRHALLTKVLEILNP